MDDFLHDVWQGLNSSPKSLQSKYFYDAPGDAIFREIMDCPEYYLTNCELDVFMNSGRELAETILQYFPEFDVVELGAGDATKSVHLLDALRKQKADFTYYPIDISANIISQLGRDLPVLLPGIKLKGLNGEYFRMLDKMKDISTRKKVALFLGSTIGNILPENTIEFLKSLRSHLATGDLVLTGFDLKKDPAVILAAYNDKGGITRRFNLNLLQRINDTLNANFDVTRFAHRPEYNEQTGACKSYLVSSCHQTVHIGKVGCINFEDGEHIFMEVSQKYTEEQIDEFAAASGFRPLQNFYDSKHWFVDALWQCV